MLEMELKILEAKFKSKYLSTKEFPFGDDAMVFKVCNKMFGFISLTQKPLRINLKVDPYDAIAYRDIYKSVIPGYHMNKKHWNTLILDGSMEEDIVFEMIDESYDLVVSKVSKKLKKEYDFKVNNSSKN